MKTLVRWTVGVAAVLVGLARPGAAQQATRFAMTCIGTEAGSAINFAYRWGESGSWENTSVEPGKWLILTWRYDYPNQNRSPVLTVRYDADFTSATSFVVEQLESYAAPIDSNCEQYGKTYNFYTSRTGDTLFLVAED
ncbi:MAG: hypothetical protein Q6K70_06220 [Thermostichales cyanobacterium DRC_bins_46]